MTPRDTELFTPVPVGDGRFALRSVYRTYVGLGEERGKVRSFLPRSPRACM